jgi:hypothetical protein
MADIFVSYTNSDRDWAFWLAAELKELGHTPHIHEWEIKGSESIYAWAPPPDYWCLSRSKDAPDRVTFR